MLLFIATIETSNTASGAKLEMLHWKLETRSLEIARIDFETRVVNTNRTITSVTNTLISVEPFDRSICLFLARGCDCQGHNLRPPLKQARGGNEAR